MITPYLPESGYSATSGDMVVLTARYFSSASELCGKAFAFAPIHEIDLIYIHNWLVHFLLRLRFIQAYDPDEFQVI